MLSDVMEHVGLSKSLRQVDDVETEHHRQLLKDLKVAIHEGGMMALTGMVGRGKTVFLGRIQDQLRQEGQLEVAASLTFDVPRVNRETLKRALYDDLATDKDGDLPSKTDKSERAFMKVRRRCQTPMVLFVDDGHDVHGHTLRGLKQLSEKTRRRGARLTLVLAGHPRLNNDLRRPSQEETGARATVFEFEGIQGHQRRSITWLLEPCAPDVAPADILTPDALERLAERLRTPRHIQHDLTRILEQAPRFGENPVTPPIVHATLAPDRHELEPTLTRDGSKAKALAARLHIRQAEVRSFLHGQLPPGRAEELHHHLLAAGIPLGDHLSSGSSDLATG
jgi:type II secretory pathway predicted ATPase ExeA